MLKIAIQAKGRLNEQSLELLSEAGIRVAESKRKLISRAEGFPLEVLYLRDDDIPQAVSMGSRRSGHRGAERGGRKGASRSNSSWTSASEAAASRWPFPGRRITKGPTSSAASAWRPPTPTSSPAISRKRESKPKSTPSKARWKSPRPWACPTPSSTSYRRAARAHLERTYGGREGLLLGGGAHRRTRPRPGETHGGRATHLPLQLDPRQPRHEIRADEPAPGTARRGHPDPARHAQSDGAAAGPGGLVLDPCRDRQRRSFGNASSGSRPSVPKAS